MIDNHGSDMYLTVGTHPAIRIFGEIISVDEWVKKLTSQDTLELTESIIDEKQREELLRDKNLDFAFSFWGSRFRGNISFQMGEYMIVLRLLQSEVPSLDELGLPDIYRDVMDRGHGLILVTGPTSSWKTTTLAAMLNYVNTYQKKHIITIEDPIEFVHSHKNSIFEQKEIGRDVPDYNTALIGSMRQAPNIILFWEMKTRQEIEMALTLAETGQLVLSTLHTRWAAQTISRIVDVFPEGERDQMRKNLSSSLIAVFSQRLLKNINGTGVVMVKEIMLNNDAVANLIRENEIHQIPTTMQMWRKEGMCLLEDEIVDLIAKNQISAQEGMKFANNVKLVKEALY